MRKRLGLTQRELAGRLDLSIQQISNYETNRNPVSKVVELALNRLSTRRSESTGRFDHLSLTERAILQEFISRLKNLLGRKLVFAVVFGSKVRGDFSAESDLDLLIVMTTLSPDIRHRIYKILFQVDPYYDTRISPVIYSLKDFQKNEEMDSPFVSRVKKEGVWL